MTINQKFKALIPPLSEEELATLEANLLADGCRDPLVTWDGVLVDGHNRHDICERHGLKFKTTSMAFADEDAVCVWIITNQFGRRNISLFSRAELALKLEPLLKAKAKERQKAHGGTAPGKKSLPQNSAEVKPKDKETRVELAKAAGVSHDTIAKAKVIVAKASDEVLAALRAGETTINAEHAKINRKIKHAEVVATLENIEKKAAKALAGKYDVVVIDPPWPMEKIARDVRPNQVAFDYPTMTEEDIEGIEIPAAKDCHLWLWTTHRFLPAAFRCLEAWGFKYSCCFTWHKPGGFQPVGLPQFNCEFALYARRGSPVFVDTKSFPVCFQAPRGKHSEKPEQFYDVVRRVTAGRRVDMFNRRKIENFDGWGQEAK